MGGGAFSNSGHLLTLRIERRDGQKNQDDVNDANLKGLVRDLDTTDHCLILHTKITSAWMNVRGNMVTGTSLDAMEFCDFLCARYDVTPHHVLNQLCDCMLQT